MVTKTLTPRQTVDAIHELEAVLNDSKFEPLARGLLLDRAKAKTELNTLYRLRQKQKNTKYPTPKKPNYNRGM
jgi:hypothetical protein